MLIEETKMFKNRYLLVLGVLSILFVTMAVSRPLSIARSPADLSWPPRPVVIPVAGTTQFSDYYARHNDTSALSGVAIPITGISADSDYFQRRSALNALGGAEMAVDMTDYFVRHAELHTSSKSAELSDYFLRH
jgi:hypothetical protein